MHKHHVIPKYRDPNSKTTVEVTVTQHAMFHFCNWQLWGDERDRLAWRGLAGIIGKEEIVAEVTRIALKKGQALCHTPEAIAKRKQTYKERRHQQKENHWKWGKKEPVETTRKKGLTRQSWNTLVISTPNGVITVSGWRPEVAKELGLTVNQLATLLGRGSLKRLGLTLIDKYKA